MREISKELYDLRKKLHRNAELSGKERKTSNIIMGFLGKYPPDKIVSNLGGHGIAAVYRGKSDGPAVLVRCDLDALPIPETISLEYASETEGIAHKCGHDGHMTIVSGLAPILHENRPDKGSVILLYQPGEEVGKGAQWVLDDKKFAEITPDYVFALHNLPGFERGQIIYRDGFFAAASKGLIVELFGETSHAAEPQKGKSPALAVSELINAFSAVTQFHTALHESAKVTVIHAEVGEVAFGTSPGYGTVMATLRAYSDDVMDVLAEKCENLVKGIEQSWQIETKIRWDEIFPSTVNDGDAVELIVKSAEKLGLKTFEQPVPFPWSEDFGNFTARYKGAMFGLGSGLDHPALHHPDYDFPDELLAVGTSMFEEIIYAILGR